MKRIGLITSGGDAPGMNACIRAITKYCLNIGIVPIGFFDGYQGIIENRCLELGFTDVNNIIHQGGTILGTARSEEFRTAQGRSKAIGNLLSNKIDALICIGGDGTFAGANVLSEEMNIPVIGIPGTIDNDISGTDHSIGYDTALNTVIDAIDKIRDTASSHHRIFFVEVMGRDAGYIALHSGIATGAENILIPETKTDMNALITALTEKEKRKKLVNLIVVAEGDEFGGGTQVGNFLKDKLPNADIRVCILGHIQRGGAPSCLDRLIASRMGYHAVECLLNGTHNVMVGIEDNKLKYTPLDNAVKAKQKISQDWFKIVKILAS